MQAIIDILKAYDAIRDDDVYQTAEVDRIAPELVPFSSIPTLNRGLSNRLSKLGIESLFSHQRDAINAAMAGNNVVLEAPTASGKTLSFAIPVLESLVQSRAGHALFIYPMKAVALDQRSKLQQLHEGLTDRLGRPIESWPYDGDVDAETRAVLREGPPSVLMTNIEFINQSFLAYQDTWETFLRGLKWVVLDEIHEYRGYFGTNAAMVLRRLVHFLSTIGSRPNFFLATATCENPREHAENLTGLDFKVVSARDSLRPKRDYVFVDPEIPDHLFWRILQTRASVTARALDDMGMSAIIFCPTRSFAEDAYQSTKRLYEDEGLTTDHVKIFKGGMRSQDRHDILAGLRSGKVRTVFSTNALELGIDLPGLDAVVMIGFPDNVMSARQQIGRAGRSSESDGLVVYIARNHPLDRFYARNLDEFLGKPLDAIVVDVGNEEIAKRHADCVFFESPNFQPNLRSDVLGDGMHRIVDSMIRSGQKPPGLGRRGYRPQRQVQIRGSSRGVFHLQCDGKPLGSLSSYQKFREAYDRAIVLQGGVRYRVSGLTTDDEGRQMIELTKEQLNHRTQAFESANVNVDQMFEVQSWDNDLEAAYCRIGVQHLIHQVTEIEADSEEFVDRWDIDPSVSSYFDTGHSLSLKIDLEYVTPVALVAVEHLMRIGMRFVIPVDEHDVFTVSDTKTNEIHVVESYPGGIGIAKKAFERWREILDEGIALATRCNCRQGCPYCIVPPRRTEELNKRAGLDLGMSVLGLSAGSPTRSETLY